MSRSIKPSTLKHFEQNYLTIGIKMSISTTRINIHVIYIFHVSDKTVKNFQDVNSFDLLWINRHRQLIQLSIYINIVLFRSISKHYIALHIKNQLS